MSKYKSYLSLLFLFSILLFLIFAEIGTRLWLVYRPQSKVMLPRYKYSPYLPYVATPYYEDNDLRNIKLNNRGFRNSYNIEIPKPKNVYRIACLGGSTTYSDYDYATNEQIWTGRLEYYLNMDSTNKEKTYQVINASGHNYNTHLNFIDYLTRLRDLELDMVIIFEGQNELYFNGYGDTSFAYYNTFKQVPFDEIHGIIDYFNNSRLFKYSKFLQKLYKIFKLRNISLNTMSTKNSHYNEKNNIENMKNNSLITFQKGLEGFIALSEMDDFKLIFLHQAYNYKKLVKSITSDKYRIGQNKIIENEYVDLYLDETDRVRDLMNEIAVKNDISCLDMTKVLNQNDEYFYRDPRDAVHFSILGEEYFAKGLYSFIKNNKLISN